MTIGLHLRGADRVRELLISASRYQPRHIENQSRQITYADCLNTRLIMQNVNKQKEASPPLCSGGRMIVLIVVLIAAKNLKHNTSRFHCQIIIPVRKLPFTVYYAELNLLVLINVVIDNQLL